MGSTAGKGLFETVDEAGGAEGVAEEYGEGHGADAPGDGGDVGGDHVKNSETMHENPGRRFSPEIVSVLFR